MEKNKKAVHISFALSAMSVDYFHIANLKGYGKEFLEEFIGKNRTFSVNVEFGGRIVLEKNIYQSGVKLSFNYTTKTKTYFLAQVETAFDFTVVDLAKLTAGTADVNSLPKQFVADLNAIAYSTSRGIIYEKFNGTLLKNLVLPIIDVPNPGQTHLTSKM